MVRKVKKIVEKGLARVTISSTLNNNIITIADINGNTLSWASSGTLGFKGSRKKTAFAAQLASQSAAEKGKESGIETVDIYLRGRGKGRESAIRALKNAGFNIRKIVDQTPIPHNGCRPPKRRRL
jgi:small subunit ribosomal protein S11